MSNEKWTYEELKETLAKMKDVSGRLHCILSSPACEPSASQLSAVSSLIKQLSDLELGKSRPSNNMGGA